MRKLDETEITARDAMTTARKEVHRHKRAVEIVASTEGTVASAVQTATGRLAVAAPVKRRWLPGAGRKRSSKKNSSALASSVDEGVDTFIASDATDATDADTSVPSPPPDDVSAARAPVREAADDDDHDDDDATKPDR